MTYTVWLGDRLIGETDLGDERIAHRFRSGNFTPVPGTETLLPITDSSLHLRDSSGNLVPSELETHDGWRVWRFRRRPISPRCPAA